MLSIVLTIISMGLSPYIPTKSEGQNPGDFPTNAAHPCKCRGLALSINRGQTLCQHKLFYRLLWKKASVVTAEDPLRLGFTENADYARVVLLRMSSKGNWPMLLDRALRCEVTPVAVKQQFHQRSSTHKQRGPPMRK